MSEGLIYDPITPGQIACVAWTTSHLTHHHCNITEWKDLSDTNHNDWEIVAKTVLREVLPEWIVNDT
jgi:hypothetical protein